VGIEWDQILHNYIQGKDEGPEQKKLAESLLKALTKSFKGLTLLDSQFSLYGYMKKTEDAMVYLWKGKADAIAWFEGKFVIVEWKAVDLNGYWDSTYGCGAHLHQCLVYAKLLQLQLDLPYLPYILIVPISGFTGKDTHPGLFKDYAQGCKDKLGEFEWSVERPENSKVVYLKEAVFKKESHKMEIDGNTKLKDLLADSATVNDLRDTLGLPKLIFKKEEGLPANQNVNRKLSFEKEEDLPANPSGSRKPISEKPLRNRKIQKKGKK
jgi:hypothetical protein